MISLYKHFLNYFILLAITILCFSGMSQIWATLLKPTFISLSLSLSLSTLNVGFFLLLFCLVYYIFLFNWVFMYVGMFYFVQIFYCFSVCVFILFTLVSFESLVFGPFVDFRIVSVLVCGQCVSLSLLQWVCGVYEAVSDLVYWVLCKMVNWGCIENEWRNQIFCIYALL